MKITQVYLIATLLLGFFNYGGATETAELAKNWQALQERQLDLLPVPKKIKFHSPLEIKQVVIVGDPRQPYFKVITKEIIARFAEIGSTISVTVGDKKCAGAYNIILADQPCTENRAQAYTLTPVADGIVLAGRENNLYAAITLRFLIVQRDQKTLIYPAQILDYPDFIERQVDISALWMWRYAETDSQKTLELIKPVLRSALHKKITAIREFAPHPWNNRFNFHRVPFPEYRKLFGSATQAKSIRQVSDYAQSLGIKFGVFNSTHALGSKKDRHNPEYRAMMYYPSHDHYFSWGRLDLHQKQAEAILDYLDRTGMKVSHNHCVDGGYADDPEFWSRRDELTRKMFGNDRAAADAAVFQKYLAGCQERGIEFDAVLYPYHGKYLDFEGIRKSMGLPQSPQTTATVKKILQQNEAYCQRINQLLPRHAAVVVREDSPQEMKIFYDHFPNRRLKIYFEAENVITRDIGFTLSQELRCLCSTYDPARQSDLIIHYVGGKLLNGPGIALFGEYAWNTAFPGHEHLDRSRNPYNYDRNQVAISARRAAEGFFGVQVAPYLIPSFDNLFSLQLAVDAKRAVKSLSYHPDLLMMVRQNDRQLQRAVAGAASALELPESAFKYGSCTEFLDWYLQLKAAQAYSAGNLAVLEIEHLAAAAKFAECKKIQDAALKVIARYHTEYQSAWRKIGSNPRLIPRNYIRMLKGYFNSPFRFTSQLLIPNFARPAELVKQAYEQREKTYAQLNRPSWLPNLLRQQEKILIPLNGHWPIEHWILACQRPEYKMIGQELRYCAKPPEIQLSYTSDYLLVKGQIYNPDLAQQAVQKLPYNRWPAGDSIEILLRPPQSTVAPFFQFVIDPNGNLCTLIEKKDANGIWKNFHHDFGSIPLQVKRDKTSWSFELKLPFKLLGDSPHRNGWRGLWGYNKNGRDCYFSRPLTQGARTAPNWHRIYFVTDAPQLDTGIRLEARNIQCAERTHESGAGTCVNFTPVVNSFRVLHHVKLTMQIMDISGHALTPERELMTKDTLALQFQKATPVVCQLTKKHDSFFIVLKLTSDQTGCVLRKIPVGSAVIKVPGPAPDQMATASPWNCSRPLSLLKGKVTFGVKSNFSGSDRRDNVLQYLLYCGRFPRQISYRDSLMIYYSRQWGQVYFLIWSSDYQSRRLNAPLNLQNNSWNKLQFEWDLTTSPIRAVIKINDHIATTRISNGRQNDSTRPKNLSKNVYLPAIGGLPDKSFPFDGAISPVQYDSED